MLRAPYGMHPYSFRRAPRSHHLLCGRRHLRCSKQWWGSGVVDSQEHCQQRDGGGRCLLKRADDTVSALNEIAAAIRARAALAQTVLAPIAQASSVVDRRGELRGEPGRKAKRVVAHTAENVVRREPDGTYIVLSVLGRRHLRWRGRQIAF